MVKPQAIFLTGALLLAGCGPGLAPVRGKVTYKDRPVTTGDILFVPDATGPTAMGKIDSQGSYELSTDGRRGAAPGSYKVMIVSMEDLAGKLPEERNPLPRLLLPEKYADLQKSGLKAEVKPGDNEINFPLP
jgi:hypothetical protein